MRPGRDFRYLDHSHVGHLFHGGIFHFRSQCKSDLKACIELCHTLDYIIITSVRAKFEAMPGFSVSLALPVGSRLLPPAKGDGHALSGFRAPDYYDGSFAGGALLVFDSLVVVPLSAMMLSRRLRVVIVLAILMGMAYSLIGL